MRAKRATAAVFFLLGVGEAGGGGGGWWGPKPVGRGRKPCAHPRSNTAPARGNVVYFSPFGSMYNH